MMANIALASPVNSVELITYKKMKIGYMKKFSPAKFQQRILSLSPHGDFPPKNPKSHPIHLP